MTASYADLVADHNQVAGMALRLIATLGDERSSPSDVLRQLQAFAVFVREHIAVEDQVVRAVEAITVPSRWQDTWDQGSADFHEVHEDLTAFLREWDEQTVVSDMIGFRGVTIPMLVNSIERIEHATRAVYSVALQTGQLTLRAR